MKIKSPAILILAALFLLFAGFIGCDLGSFPSDPPLHPPLVLTLSSPNPGEILVGFWAYNDEEAFGGYNIFMNTESNALRARDPDDCLKDMQHGLLPTIRSIGPSSDVRWVEYTITRIPAGGTPSGMWWVTVSAYDRFSGSNSRLGEIKEITVN